MIRYHTWDLVFVVYWIFWPLDFIKTILTMDVYPTVLSWGLPPSYTGHSWQCC